MKRILVDLKGRSKFISPVKHVYYDKVCCDCYNNVCQLAKQTYNRDLNQTRH